MFSSWIRYNEDIKLNKYITVPVDLKNIYFYRKGAKFTFSVNLRDAWD